MGMSIEKAVEKLDELCSIEGSELGEVWDDLVALWRRRDFIRSDSLVRELESEIIANAEHAEKYLKIVETEESVLHKVRRLESI